MSTTPAIDLSQIKPQQNVQIKILSSQMVNAIKERYTGVNLHDLRHDPSFILDMCNIIEVVFKKAKTMKVNKKDVIFEALKVLIPILTNEDKTTIDNIIEFLHSSKAIQDAKKTILKKVTKLFFSTGKK